MTQQKHFKALIRARMAKTGERYSSARAQVMHQQAERPHLTELLVIDAHDRHCMTAVFTPDDHHLVSGGFGGQARVWSDRGEMVGQLVGHESSVNAVCVAAEPGVIVTASSDKTVRVWDLASLTEKATLGTHHRQVLALAVDATGSTVWSGGHDGMLRMWDLEAGEPLGVTDIGHPITAVAVQPHGELLAVATVGGGVRVMDATGAEITRLAGDREATLAATWAEDGSFLLASMAGGAEIWSADDWEMVRTLSGGPGGVYPVAIAPDGARVAMGWDRTVGLWSADESHAPLLVEGLPKGVYGLSFSHDGTRLANAAADGRIRIWSVG